MSSKHKRKRSTKSRKTNTKYRVYIAIDFGTDGIGLAYAIDGDVYVHQAFNSRKYGSSLKPKTIVLLDNDGEVNSIGIDAKFTLSFCIYISTLFNCSIYLPP